MSKANTTKEVKVTIKRSNKLTIAEITALARTIYNEANEAIRKHNKTYQDSLTYKAEVKALKTKYGILKAERAIIPMQLKHPKVKILVGYPTEYSSEVNALESTYRKNILTDWSGDSDFTRIKNKLIVSQIDANTSILEVADKIKSELIG